MSQNNGLIDKLFKVFPQQADLILRIALGTVFIGHGSQKLFGWFGGNGWTKTIGYFAKAMEIPEFFSALVILGEFFGGIAIILGLLTRPAGAGLAVIMAGAAMKVSLKNGFFLDLKGTADGVEYVFVLFMIAVYFAVKGAGTISLDNLISKKLSGNS
ncbi:MAG TPA: DoxX family protein [Bacillota bacterium]|nr:DoxX family protein [Bacillota bacterium]